MKLKLQSLFSLLTLLLAANSYAAGGHMMIHDAWVREAPPNAKMLAGYFDIMNHSDKDTALVSATSDSFEKIELHKTEMDAGVAKMKKQDSVNIAAGKTVKFEPGGLHLMLINPKQAIKAGNKVELTLSFSNGDSMKVTAEVKKAQAQQQGGHEHHHMH